MENVIAISLLNDFIFCPVSIYFHNLYNPKEKMLYQNNSQLDGTNAHKAIDNNLYSTRKTILTGISVYSDEYKLIGKIDVYDATKKCLIERKKRISVVYDGYIYQLYAQCFCMREMGYPAEILKLYSMDDNKTYVISLPEEDPSMYAGFLDTITAIQNFDINSYIQTNPTKCRRCIYEPACDRGLT